MCKGFLLSCVRACVSEGLPSLLLGGMWKQGGENVSLDP